MVRHINLIDVFGIDDPLYSQTAIFFKQISLSKYIFLNFYSSRYVRNLANLWRVGRFYKQNSLYIADRFFKIISLNYIAPLKMRYRWFSWWPGAEQATSNYLIQWFQVHDMASSFINVMALHDDVIKWKHFPRYWPFARGIHRSPVTRSFDVIFDLRPNKRLN